MATVIEALVEHDAVEATLLQELASVTLRNWNGITVGRLAAAPELRRALNLV
jgi:L-asparaginase II